MATVDKAVHVLRIVVQMQNFGVFVCVDKLYLSRCRPSIEESLSPAGGRAEFALAHPSPPPLIHRDAELCTSSSAVALLTV